jgi:pyruvate/2-oxoglutarate dehydrogenase complex dihydrolipoamide acyltransferase (E2) component
MGPAEYRPVATEEGTVESRLVAPLVVRADHRLVDAYELGIFTQTVRELLQNPAELQSATAAMGDAKANRADLALTERGSRL